jgi:hypothetical protein
VSLSELGGYLLQHVFHANFLDFAHVRSLRKHEPPKGFATFRPAQRGTIFYAEVKFDRMNPHNIAPAKKDLSEGLTRGVCNDYI